MTFLLVDRIVEIEPGRRARGTFTAPPGAHPLPPCLVAEAVGQLAGWAAMAGAEFRLRPVAAIASEVWSAGRVMPGETADLEVEITSSGRDAIAYTGKATSRGERILELRCVGPLLPMEDFDDPEDARRRFGDLLPGSGRGGFHLETVPGPVLERLEGEPGKRMAARLLVPGAAPFFAQHFPRKPVLPATLLIDAQLRLGIELAREVLGLPPSAGPLSTTLRGFKVRAFTSPGAVLDLEAVRDGHPADGGIRAALRLAARSPHGNVASGRLEVMFGGGS